MLKIVIQERIRQRHVLLNKCRAIEYICGKHIKDPINSSCEADTLEEHEEDEENLKNSFEKRQEILNNFKNIVQKVIEKMRTERVVRTLVDLKAEKDFIEKKCFKFKEDQESILYRYLFETELGLNNFYSYNNNNKTSF